MKPILTHEVTGLGAAGDVVEVKDGYGRNYLLPRGLATPWTKGGQKQVDALTKGRAAGHQRHRAGQVREGSDRGHAGQGGRQGRSVGRLFGAVSNGDIAEAVKAAGGPELDKRKIEVKQAVKSLGSCEATVRLHADVGDPEVRGRPRLGLFARGGEHRARFVGTGPVLVVGPSEAMRGTPQPLAAIRIR